MSDPRILDGRALAERRRPLHAERARRVAASRGRAPAAHIVGFGDAPGVLPRFVERKLRACAHAGVLASADILGPDAATADVMRALGATPAHADGLFLEFPYPAGVDGYAVASAIPVALDVDVMTRERERRFFEGDGAPPVTVAAALALLDEGGVDVAGLEGVLVAERSSFVEMFAESLARRGASMSIVAPADAGEARAAQLVVVAAARTGLVRAAELASGAVVIDVGYYNAGGRGDVDVSGGIGHLAAIAPVPGGIGPATISLLVERVIEFAEGGV